MARDFDVALGAALCSLRSRAGMTVVEFVERTGIAGSNLASFEAGATIPTADLRAISAALGMSLPSFLGHACPHSQAANISSATAEEGRELIMHFRHIPNAQSRRFLIDMAHALGDYEFDPDR